MIIQIPEATPSNNAVMRMHHTKRTAEHIRYFWLIKEAMSHEKYELPIQQCFISVVRYGSRPLDWDNMGGGLKFLLDALVKNNIIKDDNTKCIQSLSLYQQKCKRKEECTKIIIDPS